ncbi:prepilin peptidase [uncultured Brevibacterium sp.]|uniref:prepilin peptidase n=1 Tax=uncultured Brevibacterium sp. TaxID=189678 RepID=UPI0025CD3632|nr:prepilin peptidase [uncultured Brevibacterium sp.]
MPEPLSLVASLSLTVLTALAVSTWIRLRFARLIDDEAGLRLLRGVDRDSTPSGLVTAVLTSSGAVIAWLAAFIAPAYLSRTVADAPILLALGLFAGATGWLFWVDSSIRRLPNRIVLPITFASLLLYLVSIVIGVTREPTGLPGTWAGAATPAVEGLISGLVVLLLAVLALRMRRTGMGGGDVKLAVVVGMLPGALSPAGPLVALVVMNLSALVHVLWLTGTRRKRWGDAIAFGPHMLIGTWTAVILGPLLL